MDQTYRCGCPVEEGDETCPQHGQPKALRVLWEGWAAISPNPKTLPVLNEYKLRLEEMHRLGSFGAEREIVPVRLVERVE